MPLLLIKRLTPEARLPLHKDAQDAGCDLYALESAMLLPGETKTFSTGIAMKIPEGFWVQLHTRSSMAGKGIMVGGGIIDNGYRGEIKVNLTNTSCSAYNVEAGDRIAQAVLRRLEPIWFAAVTEFADETARGDKGFGSSGK